MNAPLTTTPVFDAATATVEDTDDVCNTGYFFGGENNAKGWAEYMWPQAAFGGNSLQGLFSDGFVRSFIARSPAYDPLQWNPDQWLSEMSLVGNMYNANNPDLSGMLSRGVVPPDSICIGSNTSIINNPNWFGKVYEKQLLKIFMLHQLQLSLKQKLEDCLKD